MECPRLVGLANVATVAEHRWKWPHVDAEGAALWLAYFGGATFITAAALWRGLAWWKPAGGLALFLALLAYTGHALGRRPGKPLASYLAWVRFWTPLFVSAFILGTVIGLSVRHWFPPR